MNVSLSPRIEALIRQKVESGSYDNPSDVVEEAMRLLNERDRCQQELLAALAVDLEEIERGDTIPYTPELLERLKQEAEANARQGKPIDPAVTP